MDTPLFEGMNQDGWILRAKQYFDIYRLSEEKKVETVVVALEREAHGEKKAS